MVRLPGFLAAAVATTFLAAGCGSGSHPGTTTGGAGTNVVVVPHPTVTMRGIPRSAVRGMQGNRAVLIAPSSVAFGTKGTVSCAWWPTRLTVLGPTTIRIDMRVNGIVAKCGGGAVPFPIAVKLPRAVDVHKPVAVQLAYKVRLPGTGGVRRWSYNSVAPALSGS